jgi:RpiR family glv operon transcriptional regulator
MRFEEIANAHYHELNDNDRYILHIINQDRKGCQGRSINELAQRCHVSRTTILRFAQKLGFEGYSALKAFLSFEDEHEVAVQGEADLAAGLYRDMETLKSQATTPQMAKICGMIDQAERIFVYGTGATQKELAKELQRIFMRIRKYVQTVDGEAEMDNLLADLRPGDLMVLISYSGMNVFLQGIIRQLAVKGVPYVSITKLSENLLAREAAAAVYVPVTPIQLASGEYNSTALFFAAVDLIMRRYVEYMRRGRTQQA